MTDTPLIWTKNGNVPVNSLRYDQRWTDTPDEVMFEEFWFAADGELMKNNCHKLAKKQLTTSGEQAAMA